MRERSGCTCAMACLRALGGRESTPMAMIASPPGDTRDTCTGGHQVSCLSETSTGNGKGPARLTVTYEICMCVSQTLTVIRAGLAGWLRQTHMEGSSNRSDAVGPADDAGAWRARDSAGAHRHEADVDVGLAEDARHAGDDARLVLLAHQDHRPLHAEPSCSGRTPRRCKERATIRQTVSRLAPGGV